MRQQVFRFERPDVCDGLDRRAHRVAFDVIEPGRDGHGDRADRVEAVDERAQFVLFRVFGETLPS